MSCEHLVCASCAGPVVEGRCPVCRAARAEVHSHGAFGLSPQAILVALVVVLAVLIAVAGAHG
jgi:ferredoxin